MTTNDSILTMLKDETREMHEQLEALVDLPNQLQSLQNYRALLAAFYQFYAPLEAQLSAGLHLAAAGIDFAERRKLPLLHLDLQRLGMEPAGLAVCQDLPSLASPARTLGALYVVEGATLGGQIIRRLLVERLAITRDNGGAFFSGYGEQTRTMWEQFRAALSAYAARHPETREEIVAAARETFLKLTLWFRDTIAASNAIRQTGNHGQELPAVHRL